jgi:AraC-like DNA-binding protein
MESLARLDLENSRAVPPSEEARSDDLLTVPGHRHTFLEDCQRAGFSAEAAGILDDVRRMMVRNSEHIRAATLRLGTLLTPAAEAKSPSARGGLKPWQIRKIDRHLRENLERRVRLDELADLAALSVSYFCRAFKCSFGTTPHAYFTRLKLEHARRLMLNTEDPLAQIAVVSGLADQSHFCNLFRRSTGETPHAWRRRNLPNAQAETRSHSQ